MLKIPESAVPVVLASMKLAHKAYVVCVFTQAVGHATNVAIKQASLVDGTGAKVITEVCPIFANTDISLTSVLSREDDAVNYDIDVAAKNQIVVFTVNPADFDIDGGFDVLGVSVEDSSQATDFVSIVAYVEPRYKDSNYIVD